MEMKKPAAFKGLIDPDDIRRISSETFMAVRSFSQEEYPFLSDHVIDGVCLLPGAMMLELMAECGHAIVPVEGSIIIEGFRILRPLKIPEPRLLKLYARQEPRGVRISLCADYVRNGRTIRKDIVYAESFFTAGSCRPDIERNAFHDENVRCFSLTAEDIYFQDFLQSGPAFQGLGRELCFSGTHFKGSICTTQSDREFLLEPYCIDNCLQLGNIATRIITGYEVMPVGMDSLCFFNRLPTPESYCYGVMAGYEHRVSVQNFIVCDEFGTIILSASGVRQHYTDRVKFDVMEHFRQAHVRTIH